MKNATNRSAGKKAAATRKHRAAGKKAAANAKRRAAGRNASTRKAVIVVKKRNEAAKKLDEQALSEREIEVLGHVAAATEIGISQESCLSRRKRSRFISGT